MHVRTCRLHRKSTRVNCVRNIHACYMRGTLESCIFHATGKVVHANCRGTTHVRKCEVIVEQYRKYTRWCVSWSLMKRYRYHTCILHVIRSSRVANFTSSSDHALTCNSQKAQQICSVLACNLWVARQNLFTPCVQLAIDPINLLSYSRVTRVYMYVYFNDLLVFKSRVTREICP